jgi:hypothetical protein
LRGRGGDKEGGRERGRGRGGERDIDEFFLAWHRWVIKRNFLLDFLKSEKI